MKACRPESAPAEPHMLRVRDSTLRMDSVDTRSLLWPPLPPRREGSRSGRPAATGARSALVAPSLLLRALSRLLLVLLPAVAEGSGELEREEIVSWDASPGVRGPLGESGASSALSPAAAAEARGALSPHQGTDRGEETCLGALG
jgi:hypothetical protein